MAIIRQKKKHLLFAALLGMLVMAVPLGIYSGMITCQMKSKEKQVNSLKQQMNAEKTYQAYCLKTSKNKGDQIQREDLEEISLKTKENLNLPGISDLEGKYLSAGTEAGIIITDSMTYAAEGINDDLRTYFYDYIILPEGIDTGDLFDIRICFPNGEDYVVAVGKKVQSVLEGGAFINATEKENLLLASAYVDTTVYEGARIYAALYVSDYQQAAQPDYPFNLYVTQLATWDPNLVEQLESETNRQNREILEGNLFDFMGVMMGGEMIQGID
jgi:hypothetical protein